VLPTEEALTAPFTLRHVDDDFTEVRARSHVLVGRMNLIEASTLSITGLIPCAVMARFIASNICIEPTESSPIIHFNVGLTVGWVEGIEVNILGAVAGVDFRRPALKLPGLGWLGA